ncbi:MAG: putative thiosulfate sulfurtransferase [Solirubrobacterales bacterium]|nr:putative thiosulfate sulfurtransferase [Solirubrobacterales bacterium]
MDAVIRPVMDMAWWHEHRADVVLVDVRWYLDGRSGREAYERGHLPGAVFADLDRWLAGPGSPATGRHPLPDPAVFAQGMSQLGIADDDTVLAYDDAGGVIAARLVWMLRATGHEAALLDGGLDAYDGPLEQTTPSRAPTTFTPAPWPADRLADIDAATDTSATVLDARDRNRYRGDHEPIDPRAGHIPGARNLPCRENVDGTGRILPVAELRRRFADVGAEDGTSVVSYCGSGVTACHTLVLLEHAGLGHGRLYPGSWSQYSHAAARPIAVGDLG